MVRLAMCSAARLQSANDPGNRTQHPSIRTARAAIWCWCCRKQAAITRGCMAEAVCTSEACQHSRNIGVHYNALVDRTDASRVLL